jgi:hypothetical protein
VRFEHSSIDWPYGPSTVQDVQPCAAGWAILLADGRVMVEGRELARTSVENPTALHLSPDGRYAAVVQRFGRYGEVVDLREGRRLLSLDRGDYYTDVSVFPVAFIEHRGRSLVIHGSDWNRLDVSDPATGELLTPRSPTGYRSGEERPAHYLDYFHGGLAVSPCGTWIADNGWIWHPSGEVRTWSLTDWLERNVWESEDGPSLRRPCYRTYLWDAPLCWLDDATLAVWGFGDDEEEMTPGIRRFDVRAGEELPGVPGPEVAPFRVWPPGKERTGQLIFDRWLFAISPQHGTEVWDLARGERLHHEPRFAPLRYDPRTQAFLSVEDGRWTVSSLREAPAGT